jgi:hypothetical protein
MWNAGGAIGARLVGFIAGGGGTFAGFPGVRCCVMKLMGLPGAFAVLFIKKSFPF